MYKRKLLTFMYQIYKSELPDNKIRLFSSSNCCYDLPNSFKFEVPRFTFLDNVSRELESVQRLAIGLFWSGLSNLITIPD